MCSSSKGTQEAVLVEDNNYVVLYCIALYCPRFQVPGFGLLQFKRDLHNNNCLPRVIPTVLMINVCAPQ